MRNLSKRRKSFNHWRTLAWLLFIIALIFSFGRLARLLEIKDAFAQQLVTQNQVADKKVVILKTENDSLKARMEATSKIQTPDTVKAVVRYYLGKYFGKDAAYAERVFTCESGLNPMVIHVNNPGLGVDRGVAQINDRWHKARFEKMYGVPFETGTADISLNLQYAKYLWDTSGPSAWVCNKVIASR